MIDRISRDSFLMVWGLVALILFGNLGVAPLTDIDEGAFSEATREMWERRDFISPWLLDNPRFDKPVLIHWLQLVSMLIFGFNSFGARFPSAVACIFWILAIACWAKFAASTFGDKVDPRRTFRWAVILAASCIAIPTMGRVATADALLNALVSWTLYFLHRGLAAEEEKTATRLIRYASICTGFGLLAKGPIAILIPVSALLFGIWAFYPIRGFRSLIKLFIDPLSWGLVLLIVVPWYWLQYQAQGQAFISSFFGVHNVGRFTRTMHDFSYGPWYYPVWIFIALLPFSSLIIRLIVGFKDLSLATNRHLRMCWGNFIFVMVFFSFSATKLPHYGFYGLPGLIVLLALLATLQTKVIEQRHSSELGSMTRSGRIFLDLRVSTGTCIVALLATPWWIMIFSPSISDLYIREVCMTASKLLMDKFPVLLLIGLVGIMGSSIKNTFLAITVSAFIFSGMLHLIIVPTVIESLRGPIRDVATQIGQRKLDVRSWRLASPSLSFNAGKIIREVDPSHYQYVVLYSKNYSQFKDWLYQETGQSFDPEILWSQNGVQLIQVY